MLLELAKLGIDMWRIVGNLTRSERTRDGMSDLIVAVASHNASSSRQKRSTGQQPAIWSMARGSARCDGTSVLACLGSWSPARTSRRLHALLLSGG